MIADLALVTTLCQSPIEVILAQNLFEAGFQPVLEPHYFEALTYGKYFVAQHVIGEYRADFLVIVVGRTRRVTLVVEADGRAFHSSDAALVRDHRRDVAILNAGHGFVCRISGAEIVAGRAVAIVKEHVFVPTAGLLEAVKRGEVAREILLRQVEAQRREHHARIARYQEDALIADGFTDDDWKDTL